MSTAPAFPLSVVAHACSGAADLRERLGAEGLDTTTIATLVGCSPLALLRATRTGSTPRGMLIGLATLATVIDELRDHGVEREQLAHRDAHVDAAVAQLSAESPIAARMIERLRRTSEPQAAPRQLSLALTSNAA